MEFKVTGTLVWYYFVCKREVWLMSHCIEPLQENSYIEIGKLIGKDTYPKEKKEIKLESMTIDIVKEENKNVIIGEIKKSSKYIEAAKNQLLFYLYSLKEQGVEAKGKLFFPKERRNIEVSLNEEQKKKIKVVIKKIKEIIAREKPPEKVKTHFCKNCAYNEFCWS